MDLIYGALIAEEANRHPENLRRIKRFNDISECKTKQDLEDFRTLELLDIEEAKRMKENPFRIFEFPIY